MIQYDEFGIPLLDSLRHLPFAELTEDDERLERVLGRKLTRTEKAAADTMASEHASYGSSRFYLKTLLPHSGPNHLHAIGDEAATAAFFVNEKGETIGLDYSSESHNYPSFVCAHPGAATGTGGNQRDNIANNGAKVAAVYEARRQGHPEWNAHGDPIKQHTDETTQGIADYANAMGIPHGDGSIKYHPGFAGNNLVNVMAVSVAKKECLMRNKVPEGNPEDYVFLEDKKDQSPYFKTTLRFLAFGESQSRAEMNLFAMTAVYKKSLERPKLQKLKEYHKRSDPDFVRKYACSG